MAENQERRFWNELYWFSIIAMVAWIAVLWIVPPRALETVYLMRRERNLVNQIAEIEHEKLIFTKAIEGMDSDPYYREAVYRMRLGETRPGEHELRLPSPKTSAR